MTVVVVGLVVWQRQPQGTVRTWPCESKRIKLQKKWSHSKRVVEAFVLLGGAVTDEFAPQLLRTLKAHAGRQRLSPRVSDQVYKVDCCVRCCQRVALE